MSLTAVLMCNCINDTLTHQYKRLDDGGWDRSDTLVFDLPEVKVSGVYLPRVLMRSGNLFPYSKLWVCYEVNLEYPRFTDKDTVCIDIAPKNLKMVSNGLIVRTYSQDSEPIRLSAGQHGRIRIYHLMMQEEMPDIIDVGTEIRRED